MIEASRCLAHIALGLSLLALASCAQGAEVAAATQDEVKQDAGGVGSYGEDAGEAAAEAEDAHIAEHDLDAADRLDGGAQPSLDASLGDGAHVQESDGAMGDANADAEAQADAGSADAAGDGGADAAPAYQCPSCMLKVQWNTSTTASSSQSISGYLKLANTGSAPIALSGVSVRYWLRDAQVETLVVECYYWDNGTGGNKCQRANDAGANMYSDLNARVGTGANSIPYVELSFPESAGELAPGGTAPGALQLAFHLPNYAPMDQGDDPSFDATLAATSTSVLFDAPKISAYLRGQLAWGVEP